MKLHVLEGDGNNYKIVIHQTVPAGNNSAGFSWASCVVATGRNVSALTVGVGPGQTTQAEMDSILAGTTIEDTFTFGIGNLTGAALTTELDARAAARFAAQTADFGARLKWYGQTRA